jgi:hypothetical protein
MANVVRSSINPIGTSVFSSGAGGPSSIDVNQVDHIFPPAGVYNYTGLIDLRAEALFHGLTATRLTFHSETRRGSGRKAHPDAMVALENYACLGMSANCRAS